LLRLLALIVALGAAALWIEPRWSGAERTLRLRVRSGVEVARLGRDSTLRLGQWLAREASEREAPADVGAGPRQGDGKR
jgi:hypothetical protein